MNRLDPKELHLFIDEPIYILDDNPAKPITKVEEEVKEAEPDKEPASVEEPQPQFNPPEVESILIISEDKQSELLSSADETLLFKGLDALKIDRKDILIHNSHTSGSVKPPFQHSKQIVFKENPDETKLYQVLDAEGIAHLECHLLSTISNDLELKKQFWLGLKSLFKG